MLDQTDFGLSEKGFVFIRYSVWRSAYVHYGSDLCLRSFWCAAESVQFSELAFFKPQKCYGFIKFMLDLYYLTGMRPDISPNGWINLQNSRKSYDNVTMH